MVGPEGLKVAQSEYQYKSLEYKRDREKREASSPQYTAHQNAYKSLEYKRAYPNSSRISGNYTNHDIHSKTINETKSN